MDKDQTKKYNNGNSSNEEVDEMKTLEMPKANLEKYRMSEAAKEAWKKTAGSLTGKIPYGENGESLTDYISRKRDEERKG